MLHSQPPASLTINQSGMNDLSDAILPSMCLPITSARLAQSVSSSSAGVVVEELRELASQIRKGGGGGVIGL